MQQISEILVEIFTPIVERKADVIAQLPQPQAPHPWSRGKQQGDSKMLVLTPQHAQLAPPVLEHSPMSTTPFV